MTSGHWPDSAGRPELPIRSFAWLFGGPADVREVPVVSANSAHHEDPVTEIVRTDGEMSTAPFSLEVAQSKADVMQAETEASDRNYNFFDQLDTRLADMENAKSGYLQH